jgi:hypothetical protein
MTIHRLGHKAQHRVAREIHEKEKRTTLEPNLAYVTLLFIIDI